MIRNTDDPVIVMDNHKTKQAVEALLKVAVILTISKIKLSLEDLEIICEVFKYIWRWIRYLRSLYERGKIRRANPSACFICHALSVLNISKNYNLINFTFLSVMKNITKTLKKAIYTVGSRKEIIIKIIIYLMVNLVYDIEISLNQVEFILECLRILYELIAYWLKLESL